MRPSQPYLAAFRVVSMRWAGIEPAQPSGGCFTGNWAHLCPANAKCAPSELRKRWTAADLNRDLPDANRKSSHWTSSPSCSDLKSEI